MLIAKSLCLILAIGYGFGNVGRLIRGQKITNVQIFIMAVGIVGYLYLRGWI